MILMVAIVFAVAISSYIFDTLSNVNESGWVSLVIPTSILFFSFDLINISLLISCLLLFLYEAAISLRLNSFRKTMIVYLVAIVILPFI